MPYRANNPRAMRAVRHRRVRRKVQGTGQRPRLSVFRSLNHIYAQVIDDERGHTLAAASSLDPKVRSEAGGKRKIEVAALVGVLLAERAAAAGAKQLVFDRGGSKFHGRVRAVAEAARKGGLVL